MRTSRYRRDRETPAAQPITPSHDRHPWSRPHRLPASPSAPSTSSSSPSRAISLVTDRDSWAGVVSEACCVPELIAERWPWSRASHLVDPGLALVVDVEAVHSDVVAAVGLWAARAWQPLCVVSLDAAPEAGRFASRLHDAAFIHVVPIRGPFVLQLRSALQDVLESDSWIAVRAARALDCNDPVVLRALTLGVGMLPGHHTVNRWSRIVGCSRRQELEAMFAGRGLPPPKDVLDRLRLARLVHMARSTRPTLSRDELAARFGYSSGDYLGKRAKAITGLPLGDLVREGVCAVLVPARSTGS